MERKRGTGLDAAFVALSLALMAVPALLFDAKSAESAREKRQLAAEPRLTVDGRANRAFSAECDAWLADRFGLRPELVSLNGRFQREILHATLYNDTAIQGKDGWWFYISRGDGDNLSDWRKQNLLSEEELSRFKERVKATADWCAQEGIPALFVICPNKHSICGEFHPFQPRPDGITRADQLRGVFEGLGVPLVFPREELLKRKAESSVPLYYETDTHWNPLGAKVAFDEILQKLEELLPDAKFPRVEYRTEIGQSMTAGDILPMLGVERAHSTRPQLIPASGTNADLYEYVRNEGTNGVVTKGKTPALPRAMIFRDSFFTALEPFTSPLFSDAEYIWKKFTDEDKERVLAYKPDIIIFEAVERYAPAIAGGW